MKEKPFKIQIPSSSPEIEKCEVFLPGGKTEFATGWMVTEFTRDILGSGKIITSAAINRPNIQISATLDTTKERPRIAVLLGALRPLDRKAVEILQSVSEGNNLTVYWKNWKLTKVEWEGVELKEVKITTKS